METMIGIYFDEDISETKFNKYFMKRIKAERIGLKGASIRFSFMQKEKRILRKTLFSSNLLLILFLAGLYIGVSVYSIILQHRASANVSIQVIALFPFFFLAGIGPMVFLPTIRQEKNYLWFYRYQDNILKKFFYWKLLSMYIVGLLLLLIATLTISIILGIGFKINFLNHFHLPTFIYTALLGSVIPATSSIFLGMGLNDAFFSPNTFQLFPLYSILFIWLNGLLLIPLFILPLLIPTFSLGIIFLGIILTCILLRISCIFGLKRLRSLEI